MSKKDEFIKSLNKEKITILLQHFNDLRKKRCKKLSKDEYKIIYLAWMWNKGMVTKGQGEFYAFDEPEAGVYVKRL